MKTQFAHSVVQTPYGELHFDGNSKITCEDGSFESPVANSFSLPHIASCPDATEVCMAECYVHGVPAEVYRSYLQNYRTLLRAYRAKRISSLVGPISQYMLSNNLSRFRWHTSGDIFAPWYADMIGEICKLTPEIKHWIYTRTDYGLLLTQYGNMTVNLSADSENLEKMRELKRKNSDFNLTYLAQTPDEPLPKEADVIFSTYALRGRDLIDPRDHFWWQRLPHEQQRKVCPVDFFGQSEIMRCGPCKKCL